MLRGNQRDSHMNGKDAYLKQELQESKSGQPRHF